MIALGGVWQATVLAGLAALLTTPAGRVLRGRYLNRPVARLLGGQRRLWALREALSLVGLALLLLRIAERGAFEAGAKPGLPLAVASLALVAFILDDWLFGGDRPPRRRHEWARVRLRMPAPVRLRPVERWA